MKNEDVRRVIVVSKTHLDVGFTDYAENVLKRYVDTFIPGAVELAFSVNTEEKKRFVWTTGSYLVRYYLAHAAPAQRERFADALRRGYVRWHALPLTTHTELMSEELFRYGLSISKSLDQAFSCTTAAAKMTDVPGHTAAMLPLLSEAGVTFLHLGVNTSSRVPNVPALFRWTYGGASVIVNYTGGYGEATKLETGVALEFLHTLDNSGPPSRDDLERFYACMAEKYPHAEIAAGSLDDFAAEARAVQDALPVVDEEIGDTWIHGVASDPLKTAWLRRLLQDADEWIQSGRLVRGTPAYDAFMENLLLVCEHTWGMDVKKHLLDFSNWSKADFERALLADRTDYSFFGARNRQIFEQVREELHTYRGESEVSSYTHFTRSHLEQRAYISGALAALPCDLRAEADEALAFSFPAERGTPCAPGRAVEIGGWRVRVGADGALTELSGACVPKGIRTQIGSFSYESFSGKTADACFLDYGRDLDRNYAWAECDFSKPGLRYEPGVRDGLWHAQLRALLQSGDTLTAFLDGPAEAAEQYGCPRELALVYRFKPDEIGMTLYWRGKDAVRSPEALWLSLGFSVSSPNRWTIQKLNRPISPLNVVSGGNRKLHCAEKLIYRDALCQIEVTPLDAPLLSVGGRSLYRVDDRVDSLENGFYSLLSDNRWGTNFPQWFGEDMRFAYRIRIKAQPPAVDEPALQA